jgi:hypothetical protein
MISLKLAQIEREVCNLQPITLVLAREDRSSVTTGTPYQRQLGIFGS